jgi:hypothetical protein
VAASSVRQRVAASSVRRRVVSSVRLHGGRVGVGSGGRYARLADRETGKTEMDCCESIWGFGDFRRQAA